jgi:hypothetical protein
LPIIFRHAEGALKRTLNRIQEDLMVKNNSLALDQQCMATREKLSEHPKGEELAKPKPRLPNNAS